MNPKRLQQQWWDSYEHEQRALQAANCWEARMAMQRREDRRQRRINWLLWIASAILWGATLYMLLEYVRG